MDMHLSSKEDPSWGGRYCKKTSKDKATNKYHIQEETDSAVKDIYIYIYYHKMRYFGQVQRGSVGIRQNNGSQVPY